MAFAAVSSYYREVPPASRGRWRLPEEVAAAPGSCWLIGGAVFALSTTVVAGPLDLTPPTMAASVTKHLLYATAAAFMFLPGVLGDQRQGAVRGLLASGPLARLGLVSYGVFLWNMTMLYLAMRWLGRTIFHGGFPQVLAVTFALTLGVAWLSWHLLERPVLERMRPLVR